MDQLVDFLLSFYGPTPYFLIVGILFACGLGLPIPEDITLLAAGILTYYGVANLWIMIFAAFTGVIIGDSIVFYLGATYGRKLTRKPFFSKLLTEERLILVRQKFHDRGNKLIFAARFMPGLRAPIFFSAGMLHLPFRVFLFYDGTAALISVPTIIGAVHYFGDELEKVVRFVQRVEHGIVFVILAVVLFGIGKWYISHRKAQQQG